MTKFRKLLVVTTYMLVVGAINAHSQNAFITIAGANETSISNLVINDFIGEDNKIVYTANFDINLSASDNVKAIIAELQSWGASGKKSDITISRVNFNFELEESRQYLLAAVEQIVLSEIDASSKSAAKISIGIKSTEMRLGKGGGQIKSQAGSKGKMVLASNYQFTLGSLPSRKVSKIGALTIGSNNGQPKEFSIELSGAEAKEWYNWLQKNGTGSPKKEQGVLSLLGPDMKESLLTIAMGDVMITSFSFDTNQGSSGASRPAQETITKVTIGLRAASVLVNK